MNDLCNTSARKPDKIDVIESLQYRKSNIHPICKLITHKSADVARKFGKSTKEPSNRANFAIIAATIYDWNHTKTEKRT